MEVGKVLKWNNYPYGKFEGKTKPRWFVCINHTGKIHKLLGFSFSLYISTTTTREAWLEEGDYYSFLPENFLPEKFPFEEKCHINYNEIPECVEEEKIINNPDIEIKGELDGLTMVQIIKGLIKSDLISDRIKDDPKRFLDEIQHKLDRL
ncbi:MAG: hypothetical protein JW984_09985 [Deltaproteobacteria bacterium]|uniref:Uncharacterized protein n=1 Tax=Candidatus Zymogenus saltonus TaxID=2844893 RepID=A0A9D8PMU9_9DELT|nr:hypothetical protein [Candidatus Zymogenus saltonus]